MARVSVPNVVLIRMNPISYIYGNVVPLEKSILKSDLILKVRGERGNSVPSERATTLTPIIAHFSVTPFNSKSGAILE